VPGKKRERREGQKAKSASTWQEDNRRQDHVILAFKSSLEFGVL
jgi:hypothetical protein